MSIASWDLASRPKYDVVPPSGEASFGTYVMKTNNANQQSLIPENELVVFQPDWFQKAVAEPAEDHFVPFNDSRLHYRRWVGPSQDAPIVALLHGDGAHARWFDFIAPLLSKDYQLISMDLPGMGDSDWFAAYSRDMMAEAIVAMTEHAHAATPQAAKPFLIAHSFGGLIGLTAAHKYPTCLSALMICDYHIRPDFAHEEWYADRLEAKPTRVYPSRAAAEGRFRLAPEQPCENQFILDYIAEHSVREIAKGANPGRGISDEAGWTWKFDPSIYVGFVIGRDINAMFETIEIPMAAMFGGMSHDFEKLTRREMIAHMRQCRPDVPYYDIPGARHHIMLDRPHAFAGSVATQMEVWRAQQAKRKTG